MGKPLASIVAISGYWATLVLVYITWLYVDATHSILEQAQIQAMATKEQAALAREQINAMQQTLRSAERDREERFKPVVVPITDFTTLARKVEQSSFSGAPIAIENIGSAAALNITVAVEYLGGVASEPTQPFKIPSLAAGDSMLLGRLTSIGNNPVALVLRTSNWKINCTDILGMAYQFECKDGVFSRKRASSAIK